MNEIVLFALLAVVIIFCEVVSTKQRAERDHKIDEMHKWQRRQHPYRYTDYQTNNETNNEVKSNDQ